MRWTTLYVRSRRLPEAVLAAGALIAVLWAVTAWVSDAPAPPKLVVLSATLTVVALATTLATTDDALDRTAARPWPPRRGAHLIGIWAVTVALLALTLPTTAAFGPLALVVRDAAGLTGLAAVSAVVLGTHRTWIPVLAWVMPVVAFVDPGGQHRVLTWMIESTDSRAATRTATLLAVAGVVGYALAGPPRRPASESGDQ